MKIFIYIILIFTLKVAFSQEYITPQSLGASFVKNTNLKPEKQTIFLNSSAVKSLEAAMFKDSDPTMGASFLPIAFDDNLGIDQLSRSVTKKHLNRSLFGAPQYAATYYYTEFDAGFNLKENIYVQFVSDSKWNRLLYGSLNGTLKKYNEINNPGEIAINSAGMVFIADRGNSRVQVLKIKGKEKAVSLEHLYNIDKLGSVSALAFNDGGTPFDLDDDFLFVADASSNTIYHFKINSNSAQKVKIFNDLKWPSSIIFGRSNGENTNQLYVIDNYSKRISHYDFTGNDIIKRATLNGQSSQTFSAIEVDYFGHIFITDNVNNVISKYTSDLSFLDAHKSANKGFSDLNIPFGTVKLAGQEKQWVGFDQLIAMQNWTDYSGVQRYKLSTSIKNFIVDISDDDKFVSSKFTITDFSNAKFRVKQNDVAIYESQSLQIASGEQSIKWDRKSAEDQQVSAGDYSLEVEFESVYDNALQTKSSSFYLPLYYEINCGNEDKTAAIRRIKGNSANYNGIKVIEDNEYIKYNINGLNPQSAYEISVEYSIGKGNNRYQNLIIDGEEILANVMVNKNSIKTIYNALASDSYADGEIDIIVNNPDGGLVTVSNMWIKETGQNFAINNTETDLPTEFNLSQNYPNPFNPTTKIKFDLPAPASVRLAVYDVLGKKVSDLINGNRDAGVHSVEFDGSALASGIYFYKLEAGNFTRVKRMLIIK